MRASNPKVNWRLALGKAMLFFVLACVVNSTYSTTLESPLSATSKIASVVASQIIFTVGIFGVEFWRAGRARR